MHRHQHKAPVVETGIGDIDVGNPEMDRDHQALARLIEKVGDVCRHSHSSDPECNCDKCPEGKPKLCFDALTDIGHEIMVQILDHFHHEDELMKSLPRDRSTREHCAEHRREHVRFSSRYNKAVAQIDARHPVIGLRTVNAFIFDWIRGHILEYDMKLATLLKVRSQDR